MSQSSPSVSLRSTDDAVYVTTRDPKYATVRVPASAKNNAKKQMSLSARVASPVAGSSAQPARPKVEVLDPSPSSRGQDAAPLDIPSTPPVAIQIRDLESKDYAHHEDQKFASERSPSNMVVADSMMEASQSRVIVSVLEQSKVIEKLPSPQPHLPKPAPGESQIRHRQGTPKGPSPPPVYSQPEPTPSRSASGPAHTEVISFNTDDTLKFDSTRGGLENIRRMQDEEDRVYLAHRGKRALSLIKEDASRGGGEGTNSSSAAGGSSKDYRKPTVSPRLTLKDDKKPTFFRKNAGWILGFGVVLIVAVVVLLSLKTNVIVDHSNNSSSSNSGAIQIIDGGNSTNAPTSSPSASKSSNTPTSSSSASSSPTAISTQSPTAAPTTAGPVPAYSTPSCTLDQSSGMYFMKPVYGVKCFIRDDALGTVQYLDGTSYSVDLNPPTQGNSFPVEIYGDYDDVTGTCSQFKEIITCT
eukprot:TRINITY_DN510_c0_g1_i1.p1 TRINITY_DN510_c0_g1~~TRINITY_DN510_c0_g1_i1.p1  ORF type:complete len:469 (+),score=100.05 TRINITY_DN510_c0_g1_i1:106-1512(+)